VPRGRFAETGRFGRMLPYLRSLKSFKPGPAELGKVGGPMDGGSPPPSDTTQNNPRIKAGYTFLGQFIDHDLTLDATSTLEQQIDPTRPATSAPPRLSSTASTASARRCSPIFMRRTTPESCCLPRRVRRAAQQRGIALIGDPRTTRTSSSRSSTG
jgi:hypothetical protein